MKKRKLIILAVISAAVFGLLLSACPNEAEEPGPGNDTNKLFILQVYGSPGATGAVSHSFVELYNNTGSSIDLDGYSLHYANFWNAGDNIISEGLGETAGLNEWKKIDLKGIVENKRSFLILGSKKNDSGRLQIADDSGDINEASMVLSNRGFSVALMQNTDAIEAVNPFNTGNGKQLPGLVDLAGTRNTSEAIEAYKGDPARNSHQESVRRTGLSSSGNNAADFESVRYQAGGWGKKDFEIDFYMPKSSDYGEWDPFDFPTGPQTETLMILQANTYGNNNGGGGGFPRSLVELYNNTATAIDLTAGNYYLHIGDASDWTAVIKLAGTIPAKSSFLIVDNPGGDDINTTPRALLPAADQQAAFVITNNNFKVALISNQSVLSVDNPFADASLKTNYIDMLGAGTTVNGYETLPASQSRPQGPRRTWLNDTDDNSADFAQVDYRGTNEGDGMSNYQLYKFWPRNAVNGAWNPMTGEPRINPTVQQ